MNRRHVVLWGLGAAQLLIAATALVAFEYLSSDWILNPCVAIIFAQSYLAGAWIASGDRSMPWRLLVVAALFVGFTWIPSWQLPDLLIGISPGTIAVLTLLLPLRLLGFRVRDRIVERQRNTARRLQFSLRSILEWTAASAMFCSLAALVQPAVAEELGNLGWDDLLPLLLIHGPFAGVCAAELAIVLGMRRPWMGFTVLLPVVLAIAGLIEWLHADFEDLLSITFVLMFWFVICFIPLRIFGYRFGRQGPIDADVGANPFASDESEEE